MQKDCFVSGVGGVTVMTVLGAGGKPAGCTDPASPPKETQQLGCITSGLISARTPFDSSEPVDNEEPGCSATVAHQQFESSSTHLWLKQIQ